MESPLPDYGKFTVYGCSEVEQAITAMVAEASAAIAAVLPADKYRALVLIGGYGRGEGGVEMSAGVQKPHNNLDFLLILNDSAAGEAGEIKKQIDAILYDLAGKRGLGMDLGIITTGKLRSSPCLVMWHDMRFGHKTLLGDKEYVPSLTRFSPERIDPSDIRNLLVNRGTLLVINQMLLERPELSEDASRTIVKHAMKAIIGYGDALLFSLGKYHWSYVEKQKRMAASTEVAADFRKLYDAACEFRFRPDYSGWLNSELRKWMHDLISALEPVHLSFEGVRLGHPGLSWEEYADTAFRHNLSEDIASPRGIARKTMRLLKPLPTLPEADLLTRLGYRCGGWRGSLPVLFPVIAYPLDAPQYRKRARQLLEAADESPQALRRAYLRCWSTYGDTNFGTVLKKLGLSLDMPAPTAI